MTEKPDTLGANIKSKPMFDDKELSDTYNRITNDIDGVWTLFQEKHEVARKNSAFARGKQWTDPEISAHLKQFRIPYVFDQINNKVNALCGEQAKLNFEATAKAVEPGDEEAASYASKILKWVGSVNDFERVERDSFWDMVVKGSTVTQVRWENSETLYGYPSIERVPVFQMFWDTSCVESDLSDAKWMARVIPMTRQDALEEFPEHAELIDSAGTMTQSSVWDMYDVLSERQKFSSAGHYLNDSRDLIRWIEHYEKYKAQVFIVYDEVRDELEEYESLREAESDILGRRAAYEGSDVDLFNEDGSEKIGYVPLEKYVIAQNLVIGDKCVSRTITELPDFPFVVAFCYHDDGEYWSFVDQLIDPQRFLNRMLSEWDNQIGRTNKQLMTVLEHKLKRGWTIQDVNRERSKTGATIPVLSHDALNAVPNQPALPDIPNTIQFALGHMMEVVGGKNALGLQENAAESGEAVRQRQEAANSTRLPIFSHFSSWRRRLMELAFWYAKNYLPDNQVLRIAGDTPSSRDEFITLDTEVLDNIRNARLDINVSEVIDSATMNERNFRHIKEMALAGVIPPDVAADTLLELSSLSPDVKESIRSKIASVAQYNQQAAAQEEQKEMEESVMKSINKKQMKENMLAELGLNK